MYIDLVNLGILYGIGAFLSLVAWLSYYKIVRQGITQKGLFVACLSSLFTIGGFLWAMFYWFIYLIDGKTSWGNKLLF